MPEARLYVTLAVAWVFVNAIFYGLLAGSTLALVIAGIAALVLIGIAVHDETA